MKKKYGLDDDDDDEEVGTLDIQSRTVLLPVEVDEVRKPYRVASDLLPPVSSHTNLLLASLNVQSEVCRFESQTAPNDTRQLTIEDEDEESPRENPASKPDLSNSASLEKINVTPVKSDPKIEIPQLIQEPREQRLSVLESRLDSLGGNMNVMITQMQQLSEMILRSQTKSKNKKVKLHPKPDQVSQTPVIESKLDESPQPEIPPPAQPESTSIEVVPQEEIIAKTENVEQPEDKLTVANDDSESESETQSVTDTTSLYEQSSDSDPEVPTLVSDDTDKGLPNGVRDGKAEDSEDEGI